jgi:Mg-chelatase subunit ChlI
VTARRSKRPRATVENAIAREEQVVRQIAKELAALRSRCHEAEDLYLAERALSDALQSATLALYTARDVSRYDPSYPLAVDALNAHAKARGSHA